MEVMKMDSLFTRSAALLNAFAITISIGILSGQLSVSKVEFPKQSLSPAPLLSLSAKLNSL